jgi:hypothetical protein
LKVFLDFYLKLLGAFFKDGINKFEILYCFFWRKEIIFGMMFTHFLNFELEYAKNRALTKNFQKVKSFFSNIVSIILPFISIKNFKKSIKLNSPYVHSLLFPLHSDDSMREGFSLVKMQFYSAYFNCSF